MRKGGSIALLIIVAYLLAAQSVSAYYIPAEHQAEAQAAYKAGGEPGLYPFFVKYWTDGKLSGWAYDGLRGMAMKETNNGKITDLHLVMKQKYGK